MVSLPCRRWWFLATAPDPQLGLSPGACLMVEGGWGRLESTLAPVLSPSVRLVALAPARLRFARHAPRTRRIPS